MFSNLLKLRWSRFAAMLAAMSALDPEALAGAVSLPDPLAAPLLEEDGLCSTCDGCCCCCCSDATRRASVSMVGCKVCAGTRLVRQDVTALSSRCEGECR